MAENKRVAVLIAVITALRLLVIGQTGPTFEEAYYWNYSQHPMLSYFDHPPMVAWSIGLFTKLGGDTSFWVRLPAVLFALGASLIAYRIASRIFSPRVGLATVFLMALVPAFALYSVVTLPDAPLMFFWALGTLAAWEMWERDDPKWWLAVGVATGLAMLSKYPGAVVPLAPILFFAAQKRWNLLLTPYLPVAALLSLVIFSPVFIWNAQHGWVSFLYQGAGRYHEAATISDRLGSWLFQLGMWGPVGFFVLLAALRWGWRRRDEAGVMFLVCTSFPFLGLMAMLSLKRLVQLNWPLPGYFGGVILVAAMLVTELEGEHKKRFRALTLAFLATSGLIACIPYFGAILPISALNHADTVNGWKPMADKAMELKAEMLHPDRTFFAGSGYEVASEIAFHTRRPEITLANDIFGQLAKSYGFWESAPDYLGWDAVVVGSKRHQVSEDQLQRVFDHVDPPIELTVERGGRPLRSYKLYRAFGYRGPMPDPTSDK